MCGSVYGGGTDTVGGEDDEGSWPTDFRKRGKFDKFRRAKRIRRAISKGGGRVTIREEGYGVLEFAEFEI